MFQSRKSLWLLGLVGYLCFFMAIIPARLEGALLKSTPSTVSLPHSTLSSPSAVTLLMRLGLSRREAQTRLVLLRETELERLKTGCGPLLAGGDQDREFHDTMAEAGYVFLLIALCVGAIGAAAAHSVTK